MSSSSTPNESLVLKCWSAISQVFLIFSPIWGIIYYSGILYFIPGAFYCFYKCWHLFQQQQAIHFWTLSHLKLLELLNSQGQHWVMFLTEKFYFVFHQKKIHVNAFLPNDHFIPSHLIIYSFPFSEYNIYFSLQCRHLMFHLGSLFLSLIFEL